MEERVDKEETERLMAALENLGAERDGEHKDRAAFKVPRLTYGFLAWAAYLSPDHDCVRSLVDRGLDEPQGETLVYRINIGYATCVATSLDECVRAWLSSMQSVVVFMGAWVLGATLKNESLESEEGEGEEE